jgi:hypothetical protein
MRRERLVREALSRRLRSGGCCFASLDELRPQLRRRRIANHEANAGEPFCKNI